jgi:hypothetical protein
MPATHHVHFTFVDLITQTILGEEYRSLSSSLRSFLHSPNTWSYLGPNILLSTLFSNTLSLRSSLNLIDQVSHPFIIHDDLLNKCIYWTELNGDVSLNAEDFWFSVIKSYR